MLILTAAVLEVSQSEAVLVELALIEIVVAEIVVMALVALFEAAQSWVLLLRNTLQA